MHFLLLPSWICVIKQIPSSHLSSIYGLYWLCWYTNRLLGKDSSKFVSAMHKISIFPSTILSKSPDLFLIELIFRYEKITLLRWECCNRFKITLIFSLYSWLVINASIRGPIYLLNMLSTRSYLFQNTENIFCKNTIFRNRHQITYSLWSLEENEYAGISTQ